VFRCNIVQSNHVFLALSASDIYRDNNGNYEVVFEVYPIVCEGDRLAKCVRTWYLDPQFVADNAGLNDIDVNVSDNVQAM
jgi:hypothetical protein